MDLIIVESPTKAKTLGDFLGKKYVIESSYGHVRDLPKSELGIDTENNFAPRYVTPRKSQKTVTKLKKAAAKAENLILATDEDREGEAIAWHLVQAIVNDNGRRGKTENNTPVAAGIKRIVFHEITKSAIEEALKTPRDINLNLVNAQQARRVLDRLVGYKLSPFLWKKISRGLSAGRVQSAALRLIADREAEIRNFKPEEYWTITAVFHTEKNRAVEALLTKINGAAMEKFDLKTKEAVDRILVGLAGSEYRVASVERKEVKKSPLAPFTTSTLQQEGTKRLGFSSKKTMFLAQNLYENGFITYMRTDSVHLSGEALGKAAAWIRANLAPEYQSEHPRVYKNKSRLAQEAHEAIRPTEATNDPERTKGKLEKDQARLYELIWRRFIASQLPPAVFNATRAEIEALKNGAAQGYVFTATGNVLVFDGFLNIWPTKFEERELPELREGEALRLTDILPEEHHTEPPPRYNEASLVKTLEKYGIGRPSTYAPIISVIQERNYVEKQQGRFFPTEIGELVNRVLTENFPEIVDIQFTAKMEEELDEIAAGEEEWQKVIRDFYEPFSSHLEKKYEEVSKTELVNETTDEKCEKCGKPMVIKFGRFGKFMACSGFPECRNTKTLKDPPKSTGITCPKCLESAERRGAPGELIEKRVSKGRARGRIFWGCNKYPECDHATWTNPLAPEKKKGKEKGDEA